MFKLLMAKPELADKFPDFQYDELELAQWNTLESKYPDVFSRKRFLSTLRKIAK